MKTFWKLITVSLLVFGCLWITPDTYQASSTLGVASHSIEDIRAFVKAHPSSMEDATTWQTQPIITNPYAAGKISDATRTSAINMLNQVRYIAGLSYNVVNDSTCEAEAQAAALVCAANGGLSHTPIQPAGMDSTLYNLGKQGAGNSNLGYGYHYDLINGTYTRKPNSLPLTIVRGWMEDGDNGNRVRVGHRRWILNPTMTKTGFGAAGDYTAMYSMDGYLTGMTSSPKQVAWPAANMPIEFFTGTDYSFPWSIALGTDVTIGNVHVTLKRRSSNETWEFSSSSADGYFNVQNSNNNGILGQTGCIIFQPAGITYTSKDVFDVQITGAGAAVNYSVRFFELYGPESITLDAETLPLTPGSVHNLPFTLDPTDVPAASIKGITCESSNTDVATVSRTETGKTLKITAIAPGNTTITVTSADGTVSDSCVVTVSKQTQTLKGTNSYSKTYGDEQFSLDTTHEIGNGQLSYVSSNPLVASVDSNSGLVTILKSGTTTITVTAKATDSYNSATKDVVITVEKASQILTGTSDYTKAFDADPFTLDTTLSKGDGALTYLSSNTSVATVNPNGEVTIVGSGKTVITITAPATDNYDATIKQVNISVSNRPYIFSGDDTYNVTYGDDAFTLNTTLVEGTSELTYASDNNSVASVGNTTGEVTINGAGTANITITAPETEQYAKTSTTVAIIVAKAEQTLSGTTSHTKTVGDESFPLGITHTLGDGSLTYESNNPAVATVSNNGTVTIIGGGTATVTITALANSNYNQATLGVNISINKGTQTLSGTDNYPVVFGTAPFKLDMVRTKGDGTLTYDSSTPSVATVNSTSGMITINGVGQTTITVTAAETSAYTEATKSIVINVAKGFQALTGTANYSKTLGDAVFTLDTITNGDGTLTYISDNPSVADVDANGRVTLNGIGSAIITVTAAGTSNCSEATKNILINVAKKIVPPTPTPTTPPTPTKPLVPTATPVPAKKNQVITGSASYTKTHGNKAFTLNAKRTVGDGKITYASSDKKVVTVDSKGKVTIKGSGKATITINAASTSNFNAASKNVLITVKPKKVTLASVKSSAKKKITINWKKVATVTGYEIQYSTDKKFKKATTTKTITKASTTSKSYSGLKRSNKYYVRIRAYKTSGGQKIYGAWTTSKTVKIK